MCGTTRARPGPETGRQQRKIRPLLAWTMIAGLAAERTTPGGLGLAADYPSFAVGNLVVIREPSGIVNNGNPPILPNFKIMRVDRREMAVRAIAMVLAARPHRHDGDGGGEQESRGGSGSGVQTPLKAAPSSEQEHESWFIFAHRGWRPPAS